MSPKNLSSLAHRLLALMTPLPLAIPLASTDVESKTAPMRQIKESTSFRFPILWSSGVQMDSAIV